MMTCKEASQLVSQSLDRRLSLSERLGLRLHLLVCDACTTFARQMRFLRVVASTLATDVAQTLPADARERIQRALARLHRQ
jgi:hypothetical protein